MITLFTADGRLILDARPKGSKDSQDYLIDNLLPALNKMRVGYTRYKVAMTLMVDMDNSMCHNGAKITEKISLNGLGRATHLAYSPDINPLGLLGIRNN